MTQGVFLRQASGLIRTVSTRDVFIYNIGLVNIGIGLSMMILLGPAFYAGASLWLASLLVGIFCIFQALTYFCFSSIMPRTGGEYIYISRSLHPAIGFAMSFSMSLWLVSYSAWSAEAFSQQGLQSVFADLALKYDSQTLQTWADWFASGGGSLVVALIMVVLSVLLLIWGMKAYLRVQVLAFILAMVGVVVMAVVLLFSSRSEFIESFNAATAGSIAGPNPYETVINTAKETGWADPGFAWKTTLKFMVWPYTYLGFAIMSASFAGEIKKVDRAQLIGMTGAVAATTLFFMLVSILAQRVMGYEFLGAVAWNSYEAPEASTAAVPWIQYLTGMLTGNVVVKLLITLGFTAWTYFWISGCLLYATRAIFAWSFDRVVPGWFGHVSKSYHTPVNSIIVSGLLAAVFAAIYCLTDWLNTLVGILAITLTFVIMGISGLVFPYRRRELFEDSIVNTRIAGIPAMAIYGAITAAFMGLISYYFFLDDVAAGATTVSLIAVFGPIVGAFIGFFVAKAVRRRQGVDMELTYREIPLE